MEYDEILSFASEADRLRSSASEISRKAGRVAGEINEFVTTLALKKDDPGRCLKASRVMLKNIVTRSLELSDEIEELLGRFEIEESKK